MKNETKYSIPLQTSKYLIKQINRFGCYFLCILWGVCKHLKVSISPVEIMELYEQAIENKYMSKSCYVNNPAKIGTLALALKDRPDLRFYYVGSERDGKLDIYNSSKEEQINYIIDNIKIMYELKDKSLKSGSHFTETDYDPDPSLIQTGEILGTRLFYIGEK